MYMLYVLANTIYKYIQYIDYPPIRFLFGCLFFFRKHRGNGATSQVGFDTAVLCLRLDERRWLGGELLGVEKYMKNDGSMYPVRIG